MAIYACPNCGSRRIRQGALYVGALTGQKDVCQDCNYRGMPLVFDTEEEYQRFLTEIKTGDIDPDKKIELTENEKDIIAFAKEDTFKEDEDIEKKPYGLIVLCGITILYASFLTPLILIYLFLILNIPREIFIESFNTIFIISYIVMGIFVIYGFVKRKAWTYTLSALMFIIAVPIGLIFLYYLTRPHVRNYFKKPT